MLTKIGGSGGLTSTVHNQSASTAHLFVSIGNSHMIGRVVAVGQSFDAKVWEYGVAATLEQPSFAMLDHIGDGQDDLSPMLTFSDDYIAANPDVERVVFISRAEGSSGFSDNEWAADQVPNNLSAVVTQHNDAKTALEALGYTVVTKSVHYHASRPDFDDSTPEQLAADIEAMIDYLRTSLNGVDATLPVIIGGGMTATQLAGRAENDLNFQAVFNGVNRRIPYTWNMDMINAQDGFTAGLPVAPFDGVHADHAGELTKGHLHYNALLNAVTNDKPNDPFQSLSSWADWKAFHDFRSGTGKDFSGNNNHAVQIDAVTNPALMKHDTLINDFAYVRDFAGAAGTDRYWSAGAVLGQSYTKAVFIRFNDFNTQGVMQDLTDGTRMFMSLGTNEFRCYHGSSLVNANFDASNITLDQYHLIALTYDAATTTMKSYLDGVLMNTNTGVANHSRTTPEAIGAQNLVGLRPFGGAMLFAAYSDEVMELSDVQALNTASQSLVV